MEVIMIILVAALQLLATLTIIETISCIKCFSKMCYTYFKTNGPFPLNS